MNKHRNDQLRLFVSVLMTCHASGSSTFVQQAVETLRALRDFGATGTSAETQASDSNQRDFRHG